MSLLFQLIELGQLTIDNKIIIAPMCQYSANESGELSFGMNNNGQIMPCQGLAYVLSKPLQYSPKVG